MFNNLTPLVKNLLLINIIMFVIELFLQSQLGLKLSDYLALHIIGSNNFQPFQFFTYMFMHGNFQHLLFNMIALFFFGPILESFLGQKKFLILYFACGLGAAMIHGGVAYFEAIELQADQAAFLNNPSPDMYSKFVNDNFGKYLYQDQLNFISQFDDNPNSSMYIQEAKTRVNELTKYILDNNAMLGASGAIMGILIAFALLFPNTELYLLFIPFPIKAKYLIGFYILMDILGVIQDSPDDNIAHYAHLGGALVGFIIIKYWNIQRNSFY